MSVLDEVGEAEKSDLEEVIKEFIYHSEGLFAVRIQKLVFCADLYATERYGARISSAVFKPRMYGAHSEDIRAALDRLGPKITTKTARRKGKPTTKYFNNKSGDRKSLGRGRQRVIRQVYKATENLTEDELTRISKDNWLIKDADYDQPLNFKKYRQKLDSGEVQPKLWTEVSDDNETSSSSTPDGLIPLH